MRWPVMAVCFVMAAPAAAEKPRRDERYSVRVIHPTGLLDEARVDVELVPPLAEPHSDGYVRPRRRD